MKQFPLSRVLALCAALASILSASALHAQGPGVPKSLTIEQAVELALERSPNITLAVSRVNTASARVNGAFGSFLPQISVQGGYSKQLDADKSVIVQGISIPSSRPDHTFDATASANLTLFDGFSRSATYSGARSDLDASMQTLERTRQDVAYQVRTAFLNALRSEQIIEIRRNDLDLARERLAQEQARVEAGAGISTTVYTQEAEVANAELSMEQARTDVIIARNNLSLLLNYDPAAEIQLSSEGLANSIDTSEIAATRAALGSVPDMLSRQTSRRRDVQAARLRVESAASAVSAARGNYYPTIGTSLGWNWQKSDISSSSTSATFGINFQYQLFDGFRTSEQVQNAEAQRQTAEVELRKLEIEVRSELETALARLDGAERQLRAAAKSVAAARQSRYAADERFKAGVGNFTDFLLANAQYLTAQINQVNAVFNYRLALYETRYHLGE